jgi:hypothetical protein
MIDYMRDGKRQSRPMFLRKEAGGSSGKKQYLARWHGGTEEDPTLREEEQS